MTHFKLLCDAIDTANMSKRRKTLAKKSLRKIAMNPRIRKNCNYIANRTSVLQFEHLDNRLKLLYAFQWSYSTNKKGYYDRRASMKWSQIFDVIPSSVFSKCDSIL